MTGWQVRPGSSRWRSRCWRGDPSTAAGQSDRLAALRGSIPSGVAQRRRRVRLSRLSSPRVSARYAARSWQWSTRHRSLGLLVAVLPQLFPTGARSPGAGGRRCGRLGVHRHRDSVEPFSDRVGPGTADVRNPTAIPSGQPLFGVFQIAGHLPAIVRRSRAWPAWWCGGADPTAMNGSRSSGSSPGSCRCWSRSRCTIPTRLSPARSSHCC